MTHTKNLRCKYFAIVCMSIYNSKRLAGHFRDK